MLLLVLWRKELRRLWRIWRQRWTSSWTSSCSGRTVDCVDSFFLDPLDGLVGLSGALTKIAPWSPIDNDSGG